MAGGRIEVDFESPASSRSSSPKTQKVEEEDAGRMPTIEEIVKFYNKKLEKHGKLTEGFRKHRIIPKKRKFEVNVQTWRIDMTTRLFIVVDCCSCSCCAPETETIHDFDIERDIYTISFLEYNKTVKFIPHQNELEGIFKFEVDNRMFKFSDHWTHYPETIAIHDWKSGLFSAHPNFYQILDFI